MSRHDDPAGFLRTRNKLMRMGYRGEPRRNPNRNGESATVIILPIIRVERYDDPGPGRHPRRRRKNLKREISR